MPKILALASLLAGCGTAFAAPLPTLTVPFATQTPRVDAAPNDPAWQRAACIPALTVSPVLGENPAAPLPTQVFVLWDADFLYVRFVSEDKDIYTPFQERDTPHYQGDVAEVFLDAVGDGQQYYEFELSPRGGILDQNFALTAPQRNDEYGRLLPEVTDRDLWANLAWNCDGLRTATQILRRDGHDAGWIAEFALPAKVMLKRLGGGKFEPRTLRANFLRYDWQPREGSRERDLVAHNWSTVLRGCPHISPSRMGYLVLEKAAP